MQHAGTLRQRSYGGSAHSRVPDLLASDQATVDSLPKRLADEVQLEVPAGVAEARLQVRQDYGLGTHAGEGDLSREINTPKNIVRQSYG